MANLTKRMIQELWIYFKEKDRYEKRPDLKFPLKKEYLIGDILDLAYAGDVYGHTIPDFLNILRKLSPDKKLFVNLVRIGDDLEYHTVLELNMFPSEYNNFGYNITEPILFEDELFNNKEETPISGISIETVHEIGDSCVFSEEFERDISMMDFSNITCDDLYIKDFIAKKIKNGSKEVYVNLYTDMDLIRVYKCFIDKDGIVKGEKVE